MNEKENRDFLAEHCSAFFKHTTLALNSRNVKCIQVLICVVLYLKEYLTSSSVARNFEKKRNSVYIHIDIDEGREIFNYKGERK